MRYLAKITQTKAHDPSVATLEDRVLSSNPLLETFGNAQTLRNNNSSRFGKLIHIYFGATGMITGAAIEKYLLEKTRITHQVAGERNYHIFYQLLARRSDELDLNGATLSYLSSSHDASSTEADAQAFDETVECLTRIGLTGDEQDTVFGMAAAVLHLGNIQFVEDADNSDATVIQESSRPSLEKACSLLGLDEEKLSEALLTKLIVVGGKSILKKQSVEMALDKRDALAKMTYSCLFGWLVTCVNDSFKIEEAKTVLDELGNIRYVLLTQSLTITILIKWHLFIGPVCLISTDSSLLILMALSNF